MGRKEPSLLQNFDWGNLDLDVVLANSYKDFHCKGLDYICLQRKPYLTVKAYFFEDRLVDIPEVVHPHDHRYDFTTEVASGRVANTCYSTEPNGTIGTLYNQYDWDTPLNGGLGFSGGKPVTLYQRLSDYGGVFRPGDRYQMRYDQLHTIKILAPETCIVLFQYEHKLPIGQPTKTFCSGSPPEINDLYNGFTADQALKRISLLQELLRKKK